MGGTLPRIATAARSVSTTPRVRACVHSAHLPGESAVAVAQWCLAPITNHNHVLVWPPTIDHRQSTIHVKDAPCTAITDIRDRRTGGFRSADADAGTGTGADACLLHYVDTLGLWAWSRGP